MPRFQFTAIDDRQRPDEGVVDAPSLTAAVAELEAAGLTIRSISQDEAVDDATAPQPTPEFVAAVERLLDARDQLAEPLTAYVKELVPSKRRSELKGITRTLIDGSLDDAIADAARQPAAWSPLLAAAAVSSEPSVFARFVHREQQRTTSEHFRGLSLAYPLFVVGLSLLVCWPIAVFLLPTFSEIFRTFGLDLPAFTRLILAVGRFFETGGGYAIVAVTLLLAAFFCIPSGWLPAWLTRSRDAFTSLGKGWSADTAQVATTAANFVEAGLTREESLRLAGTSAGGLAGDRATRLSDQIETGDVSSPGLLAFAFAQDVPEAGRAALLRDVSECQQERACGHRFWVNGFAAPAATIAIGVVVGTIVVALFLPLVRLVEGLS
ncbi:MAG: hypothetical protein AAF266_03420 [Planctomycetota bacterium]